ncbi:substrate-binding domain-containing protein [Flexithrix dorotheae]|uniref:substrate-binding domain-containing protein n=1 Tax=Flexithrix dorotheae TaxID=70993 RepID=UPI00037FA601|nr:substrate-binding domain-containing protein [Flexithrix dorotheae]
MEKGSIRIKDIAEKANVSVGTVDRVLHNRGNVSEKAKKKVLAIIKELNYEPNLIARTLGTNKVFNIAALVPDPDLDLYWREPFNGIEKAEKEFFQYGIRIKKYTYNQYNPDTFIESANQVLENKPDAILVAPIFFNVSQEFLGNCKERNIPFVLINTDDRAQKPLSYIGQDSYQSGLLAAKMLHYGINGGGKLLIAHLAEDLESSTHLIKKEKGFRHYFEQQEELDDQFEIVSHYLKIPFQVPLLDQMDAIMNINPDIAGIFVTTSKAFEIAGYLEVIGREDIKLIGYDLLEPNINYLEKGVIDFLINQNAKGQGYLGVSVLNDYLIFKKKVDQLKYLPLDIISKENLQYYIDSEK